jgi:hypothetical protein
MTVAVAGKESEQQSDQKLDEIVRDADEFYNNLRLKHVNDTRLDVLIVSLVVWFASFATIGAISVFAFGKGIEYIVLSFLVGIVIAAIAGVSMYTIRRRRGFRFAELGVLLDKMKQGGVSSEDGLHLMDAVRQASLVAKKRKMDSAFKYGVVAFAVVAVIGLNAAIGALAGVVVYLYFRFEALREYEREEVRYEDSKRELLQSL